MIEVGTVLEEVRRLATAVERLDHAVRGNGNEGLSTKVAKHEMLHHEHGKRIEQHGERVAAVEKRVMYFAGIAAALGALVPTIIAKFL